MNVGINRVMCALVVADASVLLEVKIFFFATIVSGCTMHMC